LKSIDFAYELHETKSEGHAETIARFLTSKTNQITIICLGGDGTLAEIVNGINRFENVSLTCVPCGSGNDFALATKIPLHDPIAAMKFIITSPARPINFININGKRCINVCGFGLDTEVLKFYYKMKFLPNKLRYKIATIVKTLFFK
jgi:diacylglycerol kinase family enzyme